MVCNHGCYTVLVAARRRLRWVFLAYRLPREPSTPRIALWRKLRRLGVAQLGDGLVALPFDARTKEQLEWAADEVIEAGGEATIWLAETASAAQEQGVVESMAQAVAAEYRALMAAANAAAGESAGQRRRTAGRLRRELRRIRARDYFPPPEADAAGRAIEALVAEIEAAG